MDIDISGVLPIVLKLLEGIDFMNISGLNYTIEFLDTPPILDGEEVLGLIDYDGQKIYIDKNQHPELLEITIIHELLHGIIHDRKFQLGNLEEQIVDGLARGLYQVVKDNPELMQKLVSRLSK